MTPDQRKRLGPAAVEAMDHMRRHRVDRGIRFALLRSLTRETKPLVYADIEGLARRIHRDRAVAPIHLVADKVTLSGAEGPERFDMVGVYVANPLTGSPERFIGWAWIDSARWRVLKDALYALEPDPATRAEAA